MTVRLRSMLASLPAYVPGRTVPGAIKLASNETAYPPLPHVVERIAEMAGNINRYPDSFSTTLTSALADKYGVDPSQVAVGVGSVSLCGQLVQAAAGEGDEVIYGWRSFEAYPIVTAVGGATSVQVPLRDYVHDLDAMAARITERTRLIFVCNPNNPTSTAVGRQALTSFLGQVPDDVLVVLDEAYREFVTDADVPDGLTLLDEHPNVIVLRTFSKAYGLAGLRVGYGIAADPAVATALRQTQVAFAVTQISQEAAIASLEPEAENQLFQRVAEIISERTRVGDELRRIGYEVPPSQANFVWLPLGQRTTQWARACEDRKIIVRPFGGDGARVTIGATQENDAFLEAAAAIFEM
jgi:histidinol-phosphate aminotransferase